ncbi:MAG: hypothetical protein ACXVW1_11965 [Nocardioides sp.]
MRPRRLLVSAAAVALAAASLISAPAHADPLFDYPDDGAPSGVTVTKTWSAPTVGNGGSVTVTLHAENTSASPSGDVYAQDTYDSGLTPGALPAGCVTTSYPAYSMFVCHWASIPASSAGADYVIPFTASYVGPSRYTKNWETHEHVLVQKHESYVSLESGDTQTFSVSCPGGYTMVDESFHRFAVDEHYGTTADVQVVSSNLTTGSWDATIYNDSGTQVQGKLFATCVKNQTSTGGSIAFDGFISSASVPDFLPVGPTASEFEATCSDGWTPVALNLQGTGANANYPDNQDELFTQVGMKANGGSSATVYAVVHQPSDLTLQWRCMKTRSSTGYRMLFRLQTKSTWVAPGEEKDVDVYCHDGEKGVVGGWWGGPLNGSEPRPISRTYWYHNTSASWVQYTAKLLCVGNRLVRGGKVDKTATDERCNYLGGIEDFGGGVQRWLARDEKCLDVRQGA